MGESILKNVDDTTKVFTAILILGLTGLLFLIVFGNLTDNLGFTDDTNTTALQQATFDNVTAITFLDTVGRVNPSVNTVVVINTTDGNVIGAGNYTLTATTIIGTSTMTLSYNNTPVNISYVTKFDSQGEIDTNNVITNLSGGAVTFFSFSNVWFTLLAVVLLIIIVMSVIGVVQRNNSRFSS